METIVNISTNNKNLLGVKFNKRFEDITFQDIQDRANKIIGKKVFVRGWADVTNERE